MDKRTVLVSAWMDGRAAQSLSDTVEETPWIFLDGLHLAERAITGRLLEIGADEPSSPRIDPDKAPPWWNGGPGSP